MAVRFIAPDTVCQDPHQFDLRASDLRLPKGDELLYRDDSEFVREINEHGVFLAVRIVTAQFPIDQQIGFVRQSETWRDLFNACYDAHQCYEGWNDGDVLAINVMLPLGGAHVVEFARIHSFHVEPLNSPTLPDFNAFSRPMPLVLMPPAPREGQ